MTIYDFIIKLRAKDYINISILWTILIYCMSFNFMKGITPSGVRGMYQLFIPSSIANKTPYVIKKEIDSYN